MNFDSDYLDLAIGLAVVFFLASLVVSGLNEAFAWLLRRRAKFLWAWLYDLVSTTNELTWKLKDKRPTTQGGGDAPGSPADVIISRLLGALGPVSPTGANDKKTTIKHIPPSSLAQAFLEVFSDLGREKLATNLPALLSADETERTGGAAALGALLARPPDRPAAAVQDAFKSFAEANATAGGDVNAEAAAVDTLATALGALSGAQAVGTGLRDALIGFVGAAADARQQAAEPVISALARVFPDVLVRERFQASIESLDGTTLAPTLKRLWDTSAGEMDKFRQQFERWLQGELDRLGGFYKRSIRWITLIFVVAVTVVLNIDAVGVTQNLWRHPEGRTALVGFAQQLGTEGADATSATTAPTTTTTLPGEDEPTSAALTPAESLADVRTACELKNTSTTTAPPGGDTTTPTTAASAGDTTTPTTAASGGDTTTPTTAASGSDTTTPTADPEAAAKSFTDISNCVIDAVNALSGLGVIDTALVVNAGKWADTWSTWGWLWWRHLLGLVATGAALFLGAPFWFDIVKRITGIRKGAVGDT